LVIINYKPPHCLHTAAVATAAAAAAEAASSPPQAAAAAARSGCSYIIVRPKSCLRLFLTALTFGL